MRFPTYPKYRPSGVEWLGDVPEHWGVKRGRYCMRVNPRADRLRQLGSYDEVSFVPMEAIGELGGLKLESTRVISEAGPGYTQFQDGDVVVAKITPCFENGKGALAGGLTNGAAFGTTELHVLRAGASLDRRYLFYLTISRLFRDAGESEMYGAGGQKRVPTDFNKNFPTPLPPLPEQRAIADFLDARTAMIDRLVARKRTLVERLKEKRTSLIWRTISNGLSVANPARPGAGSVSKPRSSAADGVAGGSENRRVVPLGFLVRIRGGATPNKNDPEYWDGSIPWVSPKDMKQARISDTMDHVSEDAVRETALNIIPPGAVLVVVRGMILAHSFPVATADVPLTINQDMKALIASKALDSRFLQWALTGTSREIVARADESAHGTRKLEAAVLAKLPIPLPPPDEQRAIVGYLDRETGKVDLMAARVEAAIERLREYRAALITAAVTGQIDVRGAVR